MTISYKDLFEEDPAYSHYKAICRRNNIPVMAKWLYHSFCKNSKARKIKELKIMDKTRCNCPYWKKEPNLFDTKHCNRCHKEIKPGTGLVEECFDIK